MPSIASLLDTIHKQHPDLTLTESSGFSWSADTRMICYDRLAQHADMHLLHELAHAVLEHSTYTRDIQLIGLERDAWQYAITHLAVHYKVDFDETVIQDSLDTYRDWLHARSTCPSCQANGIQVKQRRYKCVACLNQWHVNEARLCGLRRKNISI